jgi:CheY-like chemotaxis protein
MPAAEAMKRPLSVLLVAEDVQDATLLGEILEDEFQSINLLVERATASMPTTPHTVPDVLLLAFRTLTAAEEFYLGFYRHAAGAEVGRLETIVLCSQEEVRHAYHLCRRGLFDDYVVFWPAGVDLTRLAMAVHTVIRRIESQDGLPHSPLSKLNERGAPYDVPGHDPARPAERARILVVDDDAAQRKLIGRLLERTGMQLTFASSGAEALRSISQSPPELLLLDLGLPDLDGVEVLRRLRAMPSGGELPVIIMTGNADRERVRTTLGLGAADFLAKPFDRDALVTRVQRAVRGVGPAARQRSASEPDITVS